MVLISSDEKIYIIQGVEQEIRADGRKPLQYRPIEVETSLIANAMGSARITLGGTDVIACVRATTTTPSKYRPEEGIVQFRVTFSGVTSPEYEGRRLETISEQYTAIFDKLYSKVRLKSLCILAGVRCWRIDVEATIFGEDGNIFDAISIATRAALASAQIPRINVTNEDQDQQEFKITDDPSDTWSPDVSGLPCFVTVSKIGDSVAVDLTPEEEACCSFSSLVAVTENGRVLCTMKIGQGSVQPGTFLDLVEHARQVGQALNSRLNLILDKERSIKRRETVGYLG